MSLLDSHTTQAHSSSTTHKENRRQEHAITNNHPPQLFEGQLHRREVQRRLDAHQLLAQPRSRTALICRREKAEYSER